jgi:hypothetical protein
MYLKTVKRRRLTVMEDTQLTLRDVLGPLTDFFTKLLSKDGPKWLCEFKKFLRKEKVWAQEILEFVGTVKIPAIGAFDPKDHFIHGNASVMLFLEYNFQMYFAGKVERSQEELELRASKLKRSSLDAPILAKLGSAAEVTLASIWELLKRQPNSQAGILLTNGCANIFYVRDANGVLKVVRVRWWGDRWFVNAFSVESPDEWLGGNQVFSRDS